MSSRYIFLFNLEFDFVAVAPDEDLAEGRGAVSPARPPRPELRL